MHMISEWLKDLGIPATAAFGTVTIPIAAAIFIVTVTRTLRRLLRGIQPKLHMQPNVIDAITRIAAGALWICTGLLLINAWGISVSGLWTVLVSILTAIGVGFLAVWTMVSNVTASLFISIWRPFHIGENIEMLPEGQRGRVTDRNLMFTVLHEADGTRLHVPNNFFFQKIFRVGDAVGASAIASVDRTSEPDASSTGNRPRQAGISRT